MTIETFKTTKQFVDLRNIRIHGRVLDIGGGGEGVISRHLGDSVIAIDIMKEELEESPDIGLKIIMDACELKFLDCSFDNLTCFFSLMYMNEQKIEAFLQEAYRVLRDDGCLWIWDITMPYPPTAKAFVVRLEIAFSDMCHVSTGYGVLWTRKQSMELLEKSCENAGFITCERNLVDQSFFLRVQKNHHCECTNKGHRREA